MRFGHIWNEGWIGKLASEAVIFTAIIAVYYITGIFDMTIAEAKGYGFTVAKKK